MVQPGIGGLDTPQTNIGDATYLSRQPDFDITQEPSFQSPSKDANFLQQLRNGGRPNLKTPRGNRAPFADRRNLPAGIGGAEFTPLLKSATRNSARRYSGKENGLATPAFLDRIDEDMTPMPAGESSVYVGSRNTSTYLDNTPMPQVESSSAASTPLVMRRRGGDGTGPLQDGNQLSLREQENVIDRIEKENFGLKLKIHFLEEALRKAGPGFSEAALKENTELKVDKVTMQRELQRYKKHLTSAEKDLESYRQQILDMQERAKKKFADEAQRAEMEMLKKALEDKEAEVGELQRLVDHENNDHENVEKLQDDIGDLEAEVRRKDQIINEREDELEDLRSKSEKAIENMKDAQRRMIELEQKAQASDKLEEAKETIEDLEATVRRLEQQADDMKDKLEDAVAEKDRAEADLNELQEEMANKSVVTKGLSRQVEEKIARLQGDLDREKQGFSTLEKEHGAKHKEVEDLKQKLKEARQERDSSERVRQSLTTKLEEVQADLHSRNDEKALLQTRHDALTKESASLQRDIAKLRKNVVDVEASFEKERQHSLDIERDVRNQYKDEIDRLNDEISDLQAEVREKDNLYDNDSEKWETERHNLESERDRAEERATGLQRTIDKLREAEGTLPNKEMKLQEALQSETERHKSEEAVLGRQVDDLQQDLEARQAMLEDLRNEISTARDALRQSELDYQSQAEKVEALEDEIEVLQSALDEESDKARKDLSAARRECDELREQMKSVRAIAESPKTSNFASRASAKHTAETTELLKSQLGDAADNLAKVTKEKQALQDQLANINIELHSLRTSLAQIQAERDEIEGELRGLKQQGEDTLQLDQDRINLRTAKTRLDSEVRRLKEENKSLAEQRQSAEKTLEEEIEKASVEEERLNHEILQLQSKLRQASDCQELSSARRTIRELERCIEDYESRLAAFLLPSNGNAAEGNSDLSLIRRDLSAARQKEIELLQRDASYKEAVKVLKRQIADLERRAHEAELSRLIASSPSTAGASSAQKAEITELRYQLSSAHQSIHELKKSLREADRRSVSASLELQARVHDAEAQKVALEQALDDAQAAADEAAATYERTVKKYKVKLDRYRRERDELAVAMRDTDHQTQDHTGRRSEMGADERRDLHAMLRQTQVDADALEHEVREQKEALEEMAAAEASLRKKLERARSERAAYRASAERLHRDVKVLAAAKEDGEALAAAGALVHIKRTGPGGVNTDAIIRGAEAAEQRHVKELRGMCMQLVWLRAAWEREVRLRQDAAYAKKYLLLELDIRNACNKADLAMLDQIHRQLRPKEGPRSAGLSSALSSLHAVRQSTTTSKPAAATTNGTENKRRLFSLKRLAIVVRFVVRTQIAARKWAAHERERRRFLDAVEEVARERRIKSMRDQWRVEVEGRLVQVEGARGGD